MVTDPRGDVPSTDPIPMLFEYRLIERFGWAALEGWERLPLQAQQALLTIMRIEGESRSKD